MYFWIDTQMQNTQIGVDTGIQIYNDIERFRAVESTMIVDTVLQRALLGLGVKMWRSQGRTCVVAFLPHIFDDGPVAWRCDQMWRSWCPVEKIFSCQVSSRRFHRCFTGCFFAQGAAGRNEKIKAPSRRLRLCHRWVTLPSQKHDILTGPGADLERHQEGAKWYEVIWNDPANTQKCNKKMKREVKVTTEKSKVTETRLASYYM